MASRSRKSRARDYDGPGDEADATDNDDVPEHRGRGGAEPPAGIPRWRQIEIMQERAQLRKMLDDLDMDFDELEAEVFGSAEEHDQFYRNFSEGDEEEVEVEDDEEDDFEDDYEDEEDESA